MEITKPIVFIYNPKSTSMFLEVITHKRSEQLPWDPGMLYSLTKSFVNSIKGE